MATPPPPAGRRRLRKPRQLQLPARTHGGAREGAGRRPNGPRSGVSHLRRPSLSPRHPVHVTLRIANDFPNLRRHKVWRELRRAVLLGQKPWFRICEFSVQTNHLHLIIEAHRGRGLTRGRQGLNIRLAKAINRTLGRRRGAVFPDRYHAHQLRSPREVRHALTYVLNNRRKHLAQGRSRMERSAVDPFSSAAHFRGWDRPPRASSITGEVVTARPRTWLLARGWAQLGPLPVDAVPGPRAPPRAR